MFGVECLVTAASTAHGVGELVPAAKRSSGLARIPLGTLAVLSFRAVIQVPGTYPANEKLGRWRGIQNEKKHMKIETERLL